MLGPSGQKPAVYVHIKLYETLDHRTLTLGDKGEDAAKLYGPP